MSSNSIQRHQGRPLSDEQIAVAAVLVEAIGNYSEEAFCAGWLKDIEHDLWEQTLAREPDGYDRAVEKLYAAAGKEPSEWGAPSAQFLAGLRLLAQRFQVWVYHGQGRETAIHLEDWRVLHEGWHERRLQERAPLEMVWERLHRPFPFRKEEDELAAIPPMPKL